MATTDTAIADRISAAHAWWVSEQVTPNGTPPSDETWRKMEAGLSQLAQQPDVPRPIQTALTICWDEQSRTWAMVEHCLKVAERQANGG